MTIGAFVGAAVGYYSGNPWAGLLCAGIAGGALALLHGIASISFRADQTISGVAINLLGPALAVFSAGLPLTELPYLILFPTSCPSSWAAVSEG